MAKLSQAQIYTLSRIIGGEKAQATAPEAVGWNCYGRWAGSGKNCPSIQPLLRENLLEFKNGWPKNPAKGTYFQVVVSKLGKSALANQEPAK